MSAPDPLRYVELLALLEEATTPLRHDSRNRLASIRNLAFFVRRKLGAEVVVERDPRVPEFLCKIEGEVQRADELMEGWSSRLRGSDEEARAVTLADAVQLAVSSARLPDSVTFEVGVPGGPLEVGAKLEALALATRCLIENAGEARGPGVVRVSAERVGDQCRITVSDQGPGISDSSRKLERFATTKPGHLGLGLCMARRLVARFAGELVIGSPEVGAEVSLVFPVAVAWLKRDAEP